jgi:hypothetical protein
LIRAEFLPKDQPDVVVGSAVWDGSRVVIQSDDERVREALWRISRPTAVAVDDPSLRTAGTSGPVVLQPGSSRWFQAAARARAEAEGLRVRFVPVVDGAIGWDPAGAYRPFGDVVDRLLGE